MHGPHQCSGGSGLDGQRVGPPRPLLILSLSDFLVASVTQSSLLSFLGLNPVPPGQAVAEAFLSPGRLSPPAPPCGAAPVLACTLAVPPPCTQLLPSARCPACAPPAARPEGHLVSTGIGVGHV